VHGGLNSREQEIERIAAELIPRASQLTRLMLRRVSDDISRTDGTILRTLTDGPRRITELAELEGLAQPTMTVLVKRLEDRGWVQRGRDAADGRVALIALTPDGCETLERFRAHYRAALAELLQEMSAREIAELDAATATLGRLVEQLRGGGPQP
jgi:DNA-binding MarR family transcriptional regulator